MKYLRQFALVVRAISVVGAMVLLFFASSRTTQAKPITYTFSGKASGTLGEMNFEDADYSFSFTYDTADVGSWGGATFPGSVSFGDNAVGTDWISDGTFTINGISGLLQFDPFIVVDPDNNSLTLYHFTDYPHGLLRLSDPSLNTYDMVSDFGPLTITDPSTNGFDPKFGWSSTSEGDLTFTSLSSVTFQATLVAPEAGTLALALPTLGLVGAVVIIRRRKK